MINYFRVLLCIVGLFAFAACGNSFQNEGENNNQKSGRTHKASGKDVFMVYEISTASEEGAEPSGTASLYISDKAMRSEMEMHIYGQNLNMVMLARADQPNETILLNAENQTYSTMAVNELSDDPMTKKMEEMQKDSLVIVGQTEMNGYHCTQVNVITTLNIPSALANAVGGGETVTQYWLSKEIPGYEKIQKMLKAQPRMLNNDGNAEIYQYGIPVKQVTKEDGEVNMMMELKTAEQKDIPRSLFEIPKDYKET